MNYWKRIQVSNIIHLSFNCKFNNCGPSPFMQVFPDFRTFDEGINHDMQNERNICKMQ
jgi:hypothetical protein